MTRHVLLATAPPGIDENEAEASVMCERGVSEICNLGKSLRSKGYRPRLVFHTSHRPAQQSALILGGVLGSEIVIADARIDNSVFYDSTRKNDCNPALREAFRTPAGARKFLSTGAPTISESDETILIVRRGGWGGTFGKVEGGPWWYPTTTWSFDLETQQLSFVESFAHSF